MKYVKGLILVLTIFLLSGCTNKELNKAYEKMQIDKDMTGYILDLRVYGKVDNTTIGDIVRINNYKNTDYKITVNTRESIVERTTTESNNDETTIYVVDGKKYTLSDDGTYKTSKEKLTYKDTNIYLTGLKNTKKVKKADDEKIGEETYTVYNITVKKATAQKIFDATSVDIKVKENIEAKVYITSKGYIYRIVYTYNDLTINASYFGINGAKEINITE